MCSFFPCVFLSFSLFEADSVLKRLKRVIAKTEEEEKEKGRAIEQRKKKKGEGKEERSIENRKR